MPCWYYDKKELRNTPSIQDDIDYETECRYRKEGARFIISAGTKMDLGYNTMATGVVYFHRFYMFHSFRNFPRYVTACCCLFLAGKVEETPKKCKDMITIAKSLLSEAKFAQFGDDPKEEVFALERILLQTIKFDLQVEHPYQFLLKYAKCLKGDKTKLQRMVQMAWTFVNDSLCTTLCLQWEPEVIAVALMYLAGKLSKFEVVDWVGRLPKHLFWWDMFVEDVTMTLLEDICHQVLDLYSAPQQVTPPDSPPLPRSTAFKKERVLPIPTVLSPNISQLTPSPLGKGLKPMVGEPKLPSQEKPLLVNENCSSSQHYSHQSGFNNVPPPPPPPASVFPPSFSTPGGPGPSFSTPGGPGPSFSTPGGPGPSFSTPVPQAPAPPSPPPVFPPAFSAAYPPPSTAPPPPLPPSGYYPRQPLGYFPNP